MTEGTPRPIFVVGYQRSGTTLLQSMLGSHPRIAAPPETYFIFRVFALADHFGDLADDGNLRRALHEALNPQVPLLADCGFDEDGLFERVAAGERSYRALLDAVMTDFAQRHGKVRWCEKTPIQPAASVLALFPEAQIIHIVRDPRDVVASSLEMPWTPLNARRVAADWRRFTLDNIRVGAELGPEAFLQIRYEDLARAPKPAMSLVCAFLGEPFVPEMLTDLDRRRPTIGPAAARWHSSVLEHRAPAGSGGWRARLRLDERARVAAVVAPVLPALGYTPARRSTVGVGRALNLLAAPAEAPGALRRIGLRLTARTPSRRYEATRRYARDRAEALRSAEER